MVVKSWICRFILVFIGLMPLAAKAEPMAFPLICAAGQSCFIIAYPDMGQGRDYTCGPATTIGDPFLRIGLPDVATITQGIFVVAADAGRVIDASDGVPDLVISSKKQLAKGTSNCGNGIVIDHGAGLTTAYCHLKRNSVKVAKGDIVEKGQVIGLAGQSGVALWPQLGFSIQKKGYTIDPITGGSPAEGCGFKARDVLALPDAFKTYQPAAIVTLGFADTPQQAGPVAIGKALRLAQIHPSSPSITFWGMVLGLKTGDKIETRLRDPQGRSFHYQEIIMDTDKDRQLVNIPRKRGYAYWREGLYSGELIVTRTIKGRDYTVRRSVSVEIKG